MKIKKKHHYVWKHYLKPWTKNGQIWCNRKGNIFITSLENIGQKRFFFKAEKLTDFENKMIENVIFHRHQSTHDLAIKTLKMYQISANGDEFLQKNGIEEFHTMVESTAIETLDQLYSCNLNFQKYDQQKLFFSSFIGFQYMRTNRTHIKVSEGLVAAANDFPEFKGQFNAEKISKVLSLILADAIGNWIYSEGHYHLLENHTSEDFITGDQPVFNLAVKHSDGISLPTVFELYYPLTPKLALLITKNDKKETKLKINDVAKYNDFINASSFEQIYSNTQEILEKYR
jgi:hypothetical protein